MRQIAILKNETQSDHLLWIEACKKKSNLIEFDVIDITTNDWFEKINQKKYDLFLLRPPGRIELYKRLYDERVYLLSQLQKGNLYPSITEVLIYENKRYLRDWLITNNIPHPETSVFFNKEEAVKFTSKHQALPLVAKTNIGASGNGVVFIKSKEELNEYINHAFSKGIKSKTGPKLLKGSIFKKIKKVFQNKHFLKQRLLDYSQMERESQRGFLILQEFIPHDFEWRCVRIGDSYFAHKKIALNNKSSGTLLKGYDPVPFALLNFIKTITDNTGINSVSVDVFERNNAYLVNEIQCFFGQSDPYQMLVDGKPGRYRFLNNAWIFEEGDFASNACYDLRLEHALSL